MGADTITDLMYLKGNHMEEASPWLQSAHLEPGMEVIEKPKQAQGEQQWWHSECSACCLEERKPSVSGSVQAKPRSTAVTVAIEKN